MSSVILSAAKDLLPSARRWLWALLIVVVSSFADAQVNASRSWRTIRTEHFYVHFTPELELVARRAAADAESAFVKLSAHLTPPRSAIDLVIADNVDYANGYASTFPSNRIVIYATPPVGDENLRFADDPTELVVTHELTHVFHLDRSGGVWRILRRVFGRDPWYFPNAYQPSWLVEGLAVYYESALTGSGRVTGSNHHMIARSAAGAGVFPRIDQLSLASPWFPYGYSAYAFGSLFVDHLARTYGDSALRRFVESSSRSLIPQYLNWPARRAFRTSFTAAYGHWTDSLVTASRVGAPALAGWRDVTVHGSYANVPRWLDDSTVLYDGTTGRESYGAYRLRFRLDSGLRSPVAGPRSAVDRDRIGRRQTRSANVVLPDGSLLYSQLEYRNPYDLRSDLYIDRPRRRPRRITNGARLSHPDARKDGLIVAMQTIPAGTRLAIVSINGRRITPITAGGPDEQWTEPRWSPDGTRIVAIRWTRGGTSAVVVVDTTGRIERTLVAERAVASDPSWSWDSRSVYFSSDRTGITNLYRADVTTPADTAASTAFERLTDVRTGLFEPQLSPDGRDLLAVAYRANGYHIGIVPLDSLRPVPAERIDSVAPRVPVPVTSHQSPVTEYSAWRSLAPRYWQPYFEPALDSNAFRFGALTSGADVIGRHQYQALLYVPTDLTGITGAVAYRNLRFGQPAIDVAASQDRENFRCIADQSQQGMCVGFVRRRIRDASLALTLNRVRARSVSYLSVGTGIEVRDYAASPDSLITRIDSLYRHTFSFPRVALSFGWNNAQLPALAVSAEDGLGFAVTARLRQRRDNPALPVTTPDTIDHRTDAFSVVGSLSLYKSVPLPGFAHHVVALRAAGGFIDSRNPDYLEVGGVSGGVLELFPGYSLGEGRRTFPVRGFPAAAMLGMRAYAATAEYRAPLALLGRGVRVLPLFLDRSNLSFFADVGSAWCPGLFPTRPSPSYSLCTRGAYDIGRTGGSNSPLIYTRDYTIGSYGAELALSASAWNWDRPLRYRMGVATPYIGRDLLPGVASRSFYFAFGASF